MPTVSRSFSVRPPPDHVVDYLKDFGNAVEWDPGTQRCTRIDSGPIALLNPVLKLYFEKLANDTEQQLTSVLNRLPAKEQK
jgi:hypothetical protein